MLINTQQFWGVNTAYVKQYAVFPLLDTAHTNLYAVFSGLDTAYIKQYAVFPLLDTAFTKLYAVLSGVDTA